jgi:eukaryotic-like serine/threonine-protein kinase
VVTGLQPGDPSAIGPYRLVGRLGQGGMGQVFLGVSRGGRPVAVKAIRAELAADPQFRTRFGREIAAARKVSGVFTAMVVDADVDGPVAWLATAYVPGPSLDEAVHGHGPVPEGSLLALAAGLAESLTAIHAAGVIHQDLKPSNVLLAEDGPRVIDFGISRVAESAALGQPDLVAGSPGFMSPEQALSGQAGPQSDIFSLGAVLVFAATGEGPFGTGTTAALLYRVVHESPGLGRVPATVRPLVERCLAKDPAQRPTAEALLAEVGALQPNGNWLPDTIISSFTAATAPGPALATPGTAPGSGGLPGPEVAATQIIRSGFAPRVPVPAARVPTVISTSLPHPPEGARDQRPPRRNQPRRRPRRPLVLACVIGALLVISAFTLTSASGDTPTAQDRPTTPASSPAAPTSARHTASSKSASPSPSKRVYSPAVVVPATGTTRPASPPASPSVRKSASPKPSRSASTPAPTRTTPSSPPPSTPSSPPPSP